MSVLSLIFGTLFKKKPKGPTQAQVFSDIQAYIEVSANSLVSGIQRQELSESYATLQDRLVNEFQVYNSSVTSNDTVARIETLDRMILDFQTFRVDTNSIISDSFLQQDPEFYLLKKSGTNMCFG